jgi:hypothetical protein
VLRGTHLGTLDGGKRRHGNSGEGLRTREGGGREGKGAGDAPYHNAELLRRLLDGGRRRSSYGVCVTVEGGGAARRTAELRRRRRLLGLRVSRARAAAAG